MSGSSMSRIVLITGGHGGIGLELVSVLSRQPATKVVTLGRSPASATVGIPAGTVHEQGSILDSSFLTEVFQRQKVTHLIHAAGARTSACSEDPLLAFEANILGTERVFAAAKQCSSIEQVIHFSSAAVYGGQRGALTETCPLAAESPYAISKAASELVAFGHGKNAAFQTIILRPGFVLGPQSTGSLASVIRRAVAEEEVEFQFPNQFFLHWAPDMAVAIAALIETELACKIEALHLPGRSYHLDDFAEEVAEVATAFGCRPRVDLSPATSSSLPVDLGFTRFRKLVGTTSVTSLSYMIRQVMAGGK